MNKKYNVNPESTEWLSAEDYVVAHYFRNLGFDTLSQVLEMRVFDLMNLNTLNVIRVEEIITCLYKYLNPNDAVDEAMYCGAMDQYFDYSGWRKVHKNLERITVEDLVLTEDINLKAIQHFYDCIRKKLFKSSEYDRHEYRYFDYKDYIQSKENARRRAAVSEQRRKE